MKKSPFKPEFDFETPDTQDPFDGSKVALGLPPSSSNELSEKKSL